MILLKVTRLTLAALGVLAAASAHAETVATTDGTLTVIESVAPLGNPLKFVSGGNGLIGTGASWPTFADTPANRAFAMENADHHWLQFMDLNPNGATAIRMSSALPVDSLIAVAGYDHDIGTPYEGMEFILWGSNDGSTWTQGKITAIFRDGFDTSLVGLGMYDNYSSQWSFGTAYTEFSVTGGNHLVNFGQDREGEIDAVYAPIPEPSTYALLLAGLGVVGYSARRRARAQLTR